MSSRKDPLNVQHSNVSFAGFDERDEFGNVHLGTQEANSNKNTADKHKYHHLYQYQIDRQNLVPNLNPGLVSPMVAFGEIHTIELLQEQVKRLEEVIFYVGTNNDKLIVRSDEQQRELSRLRLLNERTKEQFDLQVKKLKGLFNDKVSECESIQKNAKREVEMIEQQNERIKAHIKSIIQKKNDEIFKLTRDKDSQMLISRKDLENVIEGNKDSHRKEVDDLSAKIERFEEEAKYWKDKTHSMEKDYQALNEYFQAQKIDLLADGESNLSDLKAKYHRNKLLMLQTSQEEVKALEESSDIQRDTYLLQIENLRKHIQILSHQYRQLSDQESIAQSNYEESLEGYEDIIGELKDKIQKIYQMKEQEIEILKIKTGVLHEQNLRAVEGTYNPKIQFLMQKVNNAEDEVQKLHEVLGKEIDKNGELVRKMRIKESKHQQQSKKMKMMYDNAEDMMKHKFFTQKSLIVQQSAQIIKNYQMKANSGKFMEEELRKIRQFLDERIKEQERRQDTFAAEKKVWEDQRQTLLGMLKVAKEGSQRQIDELKKDIEQKSIQIEELSNQILKSIRETPLPDYSRYIEQIDDLKKQVMQKNEREKQLKDKADRAEKKCREYREQTQKIHLQNQVIINEAKGQWQILSQKKIQEIEEFCKKKLDFAQSQKQELKNANNELYNKITHVVERYKELESALSGTMIALQRRSDLEHKVIMLGTDNNLVKNKEQLFQN